MKPDSRLTNRWHPHVLCVVLVLVGYWIHLIPEMLKSPYPRGDGGFFAAIIDELISNRFAIPQDIYYNNLHVPLAYPPLAFYLAAGLKFLFGISTLALLKFLPPILMSGAFVYVYRLGLLITKSPALATLGGLMVTVHPMIHQWSSFGGGLTRAFGLILVAWGIYCIAKSWLDSPNVKLEIWGSFLVGLSVWMHLETAIIGGLTLVVMFGYRAFHTKKILDFMPSAAFLIPVGAFAGFLVATGFLKYYIGVGGSVKPTAEYFKLIWTTLQFTREGKFAMLSLVYLAALGYGLYRRQWIPIVYTLLISYALVRMSTTWLVFSGSIGVLIALNEILKVKPELRPRMVQGLALLIVLACARNVKQKITVWKQEMTGLQATDADLISALNTLPSGNPIVLVTARVEGGDHVSEWMPYFVRQTFPLTPQGTEWIKGEWDKRMGLRYNLTKAKNATEFLDALKQGGVQAKYMAFRYPLTEKYAPIESGLDAIEGWTQIKKTDSYAIYEHFTDQNP